jgi:hypothetical protein
MSALAQKIPKEMTAWLCEVSAKEVAFKQRDKFYPVVKFMILKF